MLLVLIVGLLMNAVALPLAARRVLFLYRAISHGQPAPDRIKGVTGRLGAAVKRQVVEVFGQKKLLKWSRARARPTSSCSGRSSSSPRSTSRPTAPCSSCSSTGDDGPPGLGDPDRRPLGAPRLPAGLHRRDGAVRPGRPSSASGCSNAPKDLGRKSRFFGSHLGPAYLTLFMIFNVIWTMFLFRGASSALGNLPYESGAFVSIGVGNLLDGMSEGAARGARGHRPAAAHRRDARLPDLRAQLQAPAHLPGAAQRDVRARAGRAGRGQADDERRQGAHPRGPRGPRRGRQARRRRGRGLQLEGHPRLRHLHRVRSLPGPVPGVEHREAALAQAADHGPARPHVGEGAVPAGRRGQARGPARGQRDASPGGRAPAGRRHRRRLVLHARQRRRRDRPRRAVVLRHLRRLRRAVPGRHRARRPHHRHAPLPGARRVELPERAQRAVQGPGEQGQPVEHVPHRPDGLGQGPAVRGQGRRRGRRVPRRGRLAVLGRLRRRLRGPRQEDHPRGGRAARHGRRLLRRARQRRDLHR